MSDSTMFDCKKSASLSCSLDRGRSTTARSAACRLGLGRIRAICIAALTAALACCLILPLQPVQAEEPPTEANRTGPDAQPEPSETAPAAEEAGTDADDMKAPVREAGTGAVARPPGTIMEPTIPEAARFFVDNQVTVGIAGTVLEDGEFHDFIYGLKDYESGEPLDTETYFGLGSATKVFTGTLLAREVVLNKIRLNQKVSDFLPRFASTPVGNITIRQLATHSSGLPRMPGNFDPISEEGDGRELTVGNADENDPYKNYTYEKLFDYLKSVDKLGKQSYSYSNVGFSLLTYIISKLNGGMDFADMVEKFIIQPAGLTGIQARWNEEVAEGISTKYDAALLPLPHWTNLRAMNGTGIVKVTLAGMKQWVKVQLYPERLPQPLEDAVRLSQFIQHRAKKYDLGIAWFFDTVESGVYQNHNGSTRGFVSEMLIDHKNMRALIYLSNSYPLAPGLCIVKLFQKKECILEPIREPKNASILDDRYVVLEKDKDGEYASYMIIERHEKFDFHYLMIDGDIGRRLFYNEKADVYYTEKFEYVLNFFPSGHGEVSEGVKGPVTSPFFRLKFINEEPSSSGSKS